MPRIRYLTLALLALASIGTAQAEGFTATIGFENVNPKSNNGTIANAAASINDDWSATGSFAYKFTDNWSAELWSGLAGFDHEVDLAGLGTVASLTHRPTTIGVNYHFNAEGKVRPYVGLGYGWVSLSDEQGLGALTGVPIDIDSSNGYSATAGVDFDVTDSFFVRGSVRYLDFDSEVFAGGTSVGEANVDPIIYGVSAGFKF
jgi:outer membrane protein